jgi:hypothetical protein
MIIPANPGWFVHIPDDKNRLGDRHPVIAWWVERGNEEPEPIIASGGPGDHFWLEGPFDAFYEWVEGNFEFRRPDR